MTRVIAGATISQTGAARILTASLAKAEELGLAASVAVVDSGGHLVAFARQDGATAMPVQIAIDKAYTAATSGLSTGGWHDYIATDGPLALGAPPGVHRLIVFAGGVPILHEGAVVGAVGVSGGHHSQDEQVATAGVAAFDLV